MVIKKTIYSLAAAALLAGCGNSTGGAYDITGSVLKGTAVEGSVSVFEADGTTLIGTDNTFDASGGYSIPSNGYEGNIKVVATLAKYKDELTGETVTVDNLALSAVSNVQSSSPSVYITPTTNAASSIIGSINGKSQSDIETMNKDIADALGLGSVDASKVAPTMVTTGNHNEDTNSMRSGAIAAAVSQEAGINSPTDAATNKAKVQAALDSFTSAIQSSTTNKTDLKNYVDGNLATMGVTIRGAAAIIIDDSIVATPSSSELSGYDAAAALAKIQAYADDNTNTAPSVADYTLAAVTGVDAENLNTVNAAIDDTDAASIPDVASIDAIVGTANAAADLAIAKIQAYADNNSNTAPTVQDYIDAGVTGVDANNLSELNATIDGLVGTQVDSTTEIQALLGVFSLGTINDTTTVENSVYTGVTPSIIGVPVGSVSYSLGGTDAADFTIDSSTGVVSMVARDFESPADDNTDNVYMEW